MNETNASDRRWRWLWAGSLLVLVLLAAPMAGDLYRLQAARKEGDLPRALAAARSLSDRFFGPLFSGWLESVTQEIRSEVVEDNLLSIKRLVPDSEESAYAEMELGRLALNQGNARQAALHLERYLKSGLGRDVDRARMDLSEAYKDLKKFNEAESELKRVMIGSPPPAVRMEASFRLGELYQFYLNRIEDAIRVYESALQDTATPGRWRDDILTNVSLLKE